MNKVKILRNHLSLSTGVYEQWPKRNGARTSIISWISRSSYPEIDFRV